MPVERREQAIAVEIGSTGVIPGGTRMFNGRRQPSRGGTSRMMREYQVRICERLGVKFPGPTRHERPKRHGRRRVRITPELRTLAEAAGRSLQCHKRTYAVHQIVRLFDYLVGELLELQWHFEPERLSGFHVDA